MSPRLSLLLPATVASVALAGCSATFDGGPRTVQTRDVAPFTRIHADDEVDVRVRAGEHRALRVRAGEKVIDDVVTDVRDGTLHVTFGRDGFNFDADVVVEVGVERLVAIEADGAGDVDASGIDVKAFEIRSTGAADVFVEGRADRLALDVSGAGDADLGSLAAREARVSVSGAGDADVRATERLDVDVDGSGDVRYHGDPVLTERVDGSGDLDHAG